MSEVRDGLYELYFLFVNVVGEPFHYSLVIVSVENCDESWLSDVSLHLISVKLGIRACQRSLRDFVAPFNDFFLNSPLELPEPLNIIEIDLILRAQIHELVSLKPHGIIALHLPWLHLLPFHPEVKDLLLLLFGFVHLLYLLPLEVLVGLHVVTPDFIHDVQLNANHLFLHLLGPHLAGNVLLFFVVELV